MQDRGTRPDGVEIGNASQLQPPGAATNWIVGQTELIPPNSLRFLRQPNQSAASDLAQGVSIKWFTHKPTDPPEWGHTKPQSTGRTFSILTSPGAFEITMGTPPHLYVVVLDQPGDFIIWGPGHSHSWRPLKESTIMTVRWIPIEPLK